MIEKLPIEQIVENPDNPRLIKDRQYEKLVKSIKDFPEMADIRPVVINKDNVIIGGNMRYKAMKEAGWTEIPVLKVDLSEEKQKEFMIKDNINAGEWDWDILANEWDTRSLNDWSLNTPFNAELLEIDDTQPTSDVLDSPKPSISRDDDYAAFDIIMLFENKIQLLEILRIVKDKENLDKQEEALMYIINKFKEVYND